jgi:hypothetical protein
MEDDQYLHELEQLQDASQRTALLRCVCAAVLLSVFAAAAHTLPVCYLLLVPAADYLHLQLVFNPFELSFVAEVDENKDNELDPGELQAHGQLVTERMVGALKVSVGGREVWGGSSVIHGKHSLSCTLKAIGPLALSRERSQTTSVLIGLLRPLNGAGDGIRSHLGRYRSLRLVPGKHSW